MTCKEGCFMQYCETCPSNKVVTCPHVGWSGGCDDCKLGLDIMICKEELSDYDNSI